MKKLLENTRFLVLGVVLAAFLLFLAALGWSLFETGRTILYLMTAYKGIAYTIASFVQLMDMYLIVLVLYIFTVAVYELFVGDLDLPDWLNVHDFDQLKSLLSNVVVLIAAVSFLKLFLDRIGAMETLLYGIGVAVVSVVLIFYRQHGKGAKAKVPSPHD